jgi:naringenin degradation protein FdeH
MTTAAKRVVTGWTEAGEPGILFAGAAPVTVDFGEATASELWLTAGDGEDVRSRVDPAAREWELEPPRGGSAFRVVTYRPGAEVGLHSTSTLDYIAVISGELTLVLPDEEVVLGPGDTLVQRATPHGWANRSDEPCVMAAVLLDLPGDGEEAG